MNTPGSTRPVVRSEKNGFVTT
ncbi:MAG: hypothetical protein QOI41_4875, partial [Myxococcales bacterium]|nr:hypothetical protein [Myxococcales bacterium]